MFARIKTYGCYQYLQLVANRKEQGKTKQQVIATLGRLDQLQSKGDIEKIIHSLVKFSENTLLVLSRKEELILMLSVLGLLSFLTGFGMSLDYQKLLESSLMDESLSSIWSAPFFSRYSIGFSVPALTGVYEIMPSAELMA